MNQITELYHQNDIDLLKKRNRAWMIFVSCFSALCVALCIVFCCLTTTRNASRMEIAAILTFTVMGWIDLYILVSVVKENKNEWSHAENMLTGEREELVGTLRLDDERWRIVGSITIHNATLDDGTEVHKVKVNHRKAAALKELRGQVTIYTVHGYIVAYGENNEST